MNTLKMKVLIQSFASSTCVHHQEEHLYMQFGMVCFSYIYVSSLAGGRICPTIYTAHINIWKIYHAKLHVQMVFLITNTLLFETCRRRQELN